MNMKIDELLKTRRPCFSFEFFPPRDETGFSSLFDTLQRLKSLQPDFVSVTYGAGGNTRRKTVDLVARIKHEIGLEPMAHLTCVGASRDEIKQVLDELAEKKLENIMALRGDPPQDQPVFVPHPEGFAHANELVEFIRLNYGFSIGAAAYPEKHPESPTLELDFEHLKKKVAAGANFLVTQLFFDNHDYFKFVEKAWKVGIRVPIIAGIMPILSVPQIKRFTQMCGARIPASLSRLIDTFQSDPKAVEQCGIYHATAQCIELLEQKIPGIHFYTLNRSRATWTIFENLKNEKKLIPIPLDSMTNPAAES
jgi:methylenetetrahydrofolate reductase (NADPH)